jgi:hypothetical protein
MLMLTWRKNDSFDEIVIIFPKLYNATIIAC